MTVTRHRQIRVALLNVLGSVIAGLSMVAVGLGPGRIGSDIVGWVMRSEFAGPQEQTTMFLAGVVWIVVFLWALVALRHLVKLSSEILRALVAFSGARGGAGRVRLVLTFLLGIAFSRLPSVLPAVVVEQADSNQLPTRPARKTSLLPALASAGLAIGISTKVERERTTMLSDAPLTARIRRPTGASLSRGIATFERAREWGTIPTKSDAMLVPVGVADTQLVYLSLQRGDYVAVEAPVEQSSSVLRHLLNTIALAPWLGDTHVVICGLHSSDVINLANVSVVSDPREAVSLSVRLRATSPHVTLFVIAGAPSNEYESLAQLGITVITGGTSESVVERTELRSPTVRISRLDRAWRVEPQDQFFCPYGVTPEEAEDFRTMLRDMTVIETDHGAEKIHPGRLQDSPVIQVRTLGPVEVVSMNGDEMIFRKSKSVELLCWLCFHRERPTISAARTALWEVNVEDATFHNVLSELRRGLTSAGHPDMVRRISKQRLHIHDLVSTDVDSLRSALVGAVEVRSESAVRLLKSELDRVRGLPFAGESYAWADAEGITSTTVWLVTRAIEVTVDFARERKDVGSVLDATAAGLRMLPGDEHFQALRGAILPAGVTSAREVAAAPTSLPVASTR